MIVRTRSKLLRRLFLVALFLTIALMSVVYLTCGIVTRVTYNRIHVGMTEDQVNAILGRTGDELASFGYEDIFVEEDLNVILRSAFPPSNRSWSSGWRRISVALDGNHLVISKYYQRPQGSWIALEIVRWVGF